MTQETYDKARELKIEISILENLKNHLSELKPNELEDYLPECLRDIDTLDTSTRISRAIRCEIHSILVDAEIKINAINKAFKAL